MTTGEIPPTALGEDATWDPFEGLHDQPASTHAQAREELFGLAKRGFVRIRKDFVQRETQPRGETMLANLVRGHKQLPLDLLLAVHALQPILRKDPLPLASWARLLRCEVRSVTTALRTLESMNLLEANGSRNAPRIQLKRINGDGAPWTDTQDEEEDPGRGFFTIPFDYWTSGLVDTLNLPGKALFLIILKETQDPKAKKRTFVMANERAKEWYGISERTAERGYLELRKAHVLLEHRRLVPDARHPLGRREEWHRALADPYSAIHREALRLRAKRAALEIAANSEGAP